jgi:chorismate-pyruvate lyase
VIAMFAKLRKGDRDPEPGLVERHFVAQEERPAEIAAPGLEVLDPFLRTLLFTEGTVVPLLAARMLAPVSVERIEQTSVEMSADVAEYLEAPARAESIRRRVSVGVAAAPALWAESFLLPERLPPGFFGLLDAAPDGIGQSLQQIGLESRRELCWYGLDAVPGWAPEVPPGVDRTLRRLYRIVSAGEPAILISEHFAVESDRGLYRLAGPLGDRSDDPRGGEPR